MDDPAAQKYYEAKSTRLRAELKQFEADWASRNGGKKPGRQDIKQNPSIASKYKKYNEVRDILAGKIQVAPPSRKRSSEDNTATTPSKRSRPIQTPSKVRTIDIEDDDGTFQTPSSRTLFSPAMPTSIGPTPQKNGRILGLFDLLEEENTENAPPNGGNGDSKTQVTAATPSKERHASSTLDLSCRSPMTPSRRNMLNAAFTTPKGRKDSTNPLGARTPSSVSKLHYLSTPSFLRRAPPPLPTVDEDGQYCYKSPEPVVRLPRKPLGRSLSSVVASLRRLEEEKLDDELEALREMEEDGEEDQNQTRATNTTATVTAATSGNTAKPAMQKPKDTTTAVGRDILEPDSQGPPQLLGGFDDEALYDSPTEEATKGRDGQPLRVYKKKGQKRTTRRVNMRPTRAKRPTTDDQDDNDDDEEQEEEQENNDEVVPETQFDATNKPIDIDFSSLDADSASDSDFAAGDDDDLGLEDEDVPAPAPAKKNLLKKKKKEKKEKGEKEQTEEKKEGKVKKAARKVNELAHANFKRLKLRNNGSKGGPGFGSRFRRRR